VPRSQSKAGKSSNDNIYLNKRAGDGLSFLFTILKPFILQDLQEGIFPQISHPFYYIPQKIVF